MTGSKLFRNAKVLTTNLMIHGSTVISFVNASYEGTVS